MIQPSSPIAGHESPTVIIVGSSARAAAFSALRSGLTPICIDQFADADLQLAAQAIRVADYPHGFIAALEPLGNDPLLYLGGLENHPEIIQQFADRQPLLGASVEVLGRVRDPFHVASEFAKPRFPCLEVCPADAPPSRNGAWLMKPLHGTGGRGITEWNDSARLPDEPIYFQRRQAGDSYSALFVAPSGTTDVRFVGITRQFNGGELLGAGPFAWCGSVGPVTLPMATEHMVRRIGNFLSWRFGMRGIFGIDFILDDDVPWITDVNPRYPASAEVLEHICGLTLLSDHFRVFIDDAPPLNETPPTPVAAMGKFVLYAKSAFQAPELDQWLQEGDLEAHDLWRRTPRIADIPRPGTRIRQGEPICTLFTVGATPDKCLEQLPDIVRDTESRLIL
jgi:predicted ATP-grasp superfamily ATP-dependent carboligase